MKKRILLLATIALLASCLPLTTNAATQVYDLKADWSNTQNPNGPWSYRQGDTLLINNPFPWVGAGYGCFFPVPCPVPPLVPAMEKVAGFVNAWGNFYFLSPGYIEDGDVLVVPGIGGNILWTAPVSGTIDISGATWLVDPICFYEPYPSFPFWTLTHNGSSLSGGNVEVTVCGSAADGNPRGFPYDFSSGSGGTAALQNIPVAAGDQIVLAFSSSTRAAAGLNLTIALTPAGGVCPNASFADDAIIWHQPLARNGASEDTDPSAGRTVKYRFKRGSTIPIQVQALGAMDDNAAPIDFNGVGGGGGVMDKIGGHLKYNLDTKSLPTTTRCYILRVTVTDTSTGEEKFEEVLLQAK